MQSITIGTAEGIETVRQRLAEGFRPLVEEGMVLDLREASQGGLSFLGCRVVSPGPGPRGPGDAESTFRHILANVISDLVMERWEAALADKVLHQSYYYFTPEERNQIMVRAETSLGSGEGPDSEQRPSRRAQVLARVLDHLEEHDEIVLEGFITFRLKDYVVQLDDAVDRAVDDFLMEREYREFIRLLKYFVDVQEPRIAEVHVLLDQQGGFRLTDGAGNLIKDPHLEEFVVDLVDNDVNYEDLLISTLIAVAPATVTLHCHRTLDDDESVETITGVFAGRVKVCHGCPRCLSVPGLMKLEPNPT